MKCYEIFSKLSPELTNQIFAYLLESEKPVYKAMIQNIATNGHADLHHTLNTLDLGRPEGLSHSMHGDQYREDLFFRYNQTMQYFFDASARVATEFME